MCSSINGFSYFPSLRREAKRETERDQVKESIPFLAGGVPNLSFDELVSNLNVPVSEFHSDGRLRVQSELIPGESGQEIGFPDGRVPDQNSLEQIIALVVERIGGHTGYTFLFLRSVEKEEENRRKGGEVGESRETGMAVYV